MIVAGLFRGTIQTTFVLLLMAAALLCCSTRKNTFDETGSRSVTRQLSTKELHVLYYVQVDKDVKIKDYFDFMDSLACTLDSTLRVNEYVLLHANPWILDSLKATDYYRMKARGVILRDQPQYVILHNGDSLAVPDSTFVSGVIRKLNSTVLDVNIPEYKLRIIQNKHTILICEVRVGRNDAEYLAVAKHIVNLRTPIGVGEIVRIAKIPYVMNPKTGVKYDSTCRDDGYYTKMPVIPWLEPSINGIRYGAMIHPTTNPQTLGRPYSHGCVGTNEADAWTIYANAPIGTKVIFRYNLDVINEKGDTVKLRDIYRID